MYVRLVVLLEKKQHNVYLAHVWVPNLNTQNRGPFVGVNLGGTNILKQMVIVGRDFLFNSVLIYNGVTGDITLSR